MTRGLANERSKVTPALLLMSAHSAASTDSGGGANVERRSLFSGDYWTISACSGCNGWKSILFPKRKGRGSGVGSRFSADFSVRIHIIQCVLCFIVWREGGNSVSNLVAPPRKLAPLQRGVACATLQFVRLCCYFLLFSTFSFLVKYLFYLNAENLRQLFLSFALQRGQVCSIKVAFEFKSSVFRGAVLWARRHSADISKAPSSNRHLWWNI